MADGNAPGNLPGAPVTTYVGLNALPKTGRNGFGIASVTGTLGRFTVGLFGTVSLGASARLDLAANGAGVPPHNAGNLGGGVLSSHKALDLVSFFSAEVLLHWATSTWRLKRS